MSVNNPSNVDQQEIAKFSAMAKTWWDPDGDMKPLHQLNPLRLQFIKDQVELKNTSILDVGCGGGILTESLAQSAATAKGIDLSEEAIAVAKQHAEKSKLQIDYEVISIEDKAIKIDKIGSIGYQRVK